MGPISSSLEWFPYWGKSGEQAGEWHPLAFHSVDVASVARVLTERDDRFRSVVAATSRLPETTIPTLVEQLLLFHDLGKFADGFQSLRPELRTRLRGELPLFEYARRHDSLGFCLWSEALLAEWIAHEWLSVTNRTGDPIRDVLHVEDIVAPWFRASFGHHGTPPRVVDVEGHTRFFDRLPREGAAAFCRDAFAMLGPMPLSFGTDEVAEHLLTRSAWLIAGLAILADWIGSNRAWFPYFTEPIPMAAYRELALPRAKKAVDAAGVLPKRAGAPARLPDLFPHIAKPSPLQRFAQEADLGKGPQLFILEDLTGSGKTEAAVMLAHRLVSSGRAAGLYVAMPTMATANGMDLRIRPVIERFFEVGANPTYVLAHSAARAQERWGGPEDRPYAPGEPAASSTGGAWIADSRKKALLADVGVGTIDQALLAVLHARHATLRLLGLHRKVLIVDEVHAYDAYMSRVLERLLQFHACHGGHAILLSATLPARMKRQFATAFGRGASREDEPVMRSEAYPLATRVTRDLVDEWPIHARAQAERRVSVESLVSTDDVVGRLRAAVRDNGCACWIRNTVRDAREAYALIRQQVPEARVLLFHARFALGDRLRIENEVLRHFGPRSGPAERARVILVATQVVEQSLDLDFDELVSDLAPVDLLIQRAGRLHRHARDIDGRRAESETRSPPRLAIYGPAFTEAPPADWVSAKLPRAALVYPDHGKLWLTARTITERGCLSIPDDARRLVESVYGDTAEDVIPPGLRARTIRVEGEASATGSVASMNAVSLDEGYASDATWLDDRITPTRQGDPTVLLRLAVSEGGRLAPARGEAWELSQVSVRAAVASTRSPSTDEAAVTRAEATMPDRGRWSLTIPIDGEGRARVLGSDGRARSLRYSLELGLLIGEEADA